MKKNTAKANTYLFFHYIKLFKETLKLVTVFLKTDLPHETLGKKGSTKSLKMTKTVRQRSQQLHH